MAVYERFTLVVQRRWLFLTAGVLWGAAGLMLCVRAVGWFRAEGLHAVPWEVIGLIAGVVIYRFKFAKIAEKNIKRILKLRERESIFAFQSPVMYAVIGFMMSLGIALRHSPIPKLYLAVLYTGIGLGLLLASLRYVRHVSR